MDVYSAPAEIKVPEYSPKKSTDVFIQECIEYEKAVSEWAKENSTPHKLAGEIVRTPFADGYATYVVAKLNNKVCLIHIETMDAWADARFERTVTVAELTDMVRHAKTIGKLFR